MSEERPRRRYHCFEVDGDGKIIKPTLRPHEPDWQGASVVPPGEAGALMFRDRGEIVIQTLKRMV
ncbi:MULTISPECIES: hypothetical protein [unclassified Rhizobium]|uniref:hypothetical protein n=1 Tax=unclassified Rhizobium TaxID=2613769 RepID=UPI0016013719|nr:MULTISPECIES: hypothetical protein [unclassified Rhizobium]MBB1250870.1 hypothetical protein [Rhizobium sp. G21]MCV3764364.1 hypothetical protein [Rhizobium sp. TRM95796]